MSPHTPNAASFSRMRGSAALICANALAAIVVLSGANACGARWLTMSLALG